MADHALPVLTSTYANFILQLNGRFNDLALFLDPAVVTATNVPVNSIRWSSASNTWQKWNGTAWNTWTTTLSVPNLIVTGNTTLGDTAADTTQVSGSIGIGGTSHVGRGINVINAGLTGTTQTGVYSQPVSTTSATNIVAGFLSQPQTVDASFTLAAICGLYAANPTKGTASTITSAYGLYIVDQTVGVNNIGISSNVSQGTNKWNIYAGGTAANFFGGLVGIGINSPSMSASTFGAHVHNATASQGTQIRITNAGTGSTSTDGMVLGNNADGSAYLTNTEAQSLTFGTSGVTRLTLSSLGFLTSAVDYSGPTGHYFTNSSSAANASSCFFVSNSASPGGTNSLGIAAIGAGFTNVGAYRTNGATLDAGASLVGGLSIVSQGTAATAGIRVYTSGYGDGQLRMHISNSGKVTFGSGVINSTPFDVLQTYTAGAVIDAALFGHNSSSNPTTGQGARVYLSSTSSITRAAAIEAVVSNGLNGHHLAFLTNIAGAVATEKVRVDAEGYVGIGVVPSARNNSRLQLVDGIGFPATQVASSDANTLDDYEEGTFTPSIVGDTVAGTATYGSRAGRYTKIGNRVFFTLAVAWSAHTGTGQMRVGGIPFTSGNYAGSPDLFTILSDNLTYTNTLGAWVIAASTLISIYTYATNTSGAPLAVDPAGSIYITGSYQV